MAEEISGTGFGEAKTGAVIGVSPPEGTRLLSAPAFYASAMQSMAVGNDCILIFTQFRPALVDSTATQGVVAFNEPQCSINMSLHTAKDLALMLGKLVDDFEKQYGKLDTEYVRRVTASAG